MNKHHDSDNYYDICVYQKNVHMGSQYKTDDIYNVVINNDNKQSLST